MNCLFSSFVGAVRDICCRIALLVFPLVILIVACSSHKGGQKEEPLRIGYIPIAECLPLYVAKEMGFFERENVEVELVPEQGGAIILQNLGNNLDIGFSNVVSLVHHKVKGSDVFSIYGATYETFRHQNHAIIVRGKLELRTPRESLKSRTFAVNTLNNIESLMLEKFMQDSLQMRKDVDYEIVTAPFPQMLPSLEAGSLDAACMVEPFITIAREDSLKNTAWFCNQYLSLGARTLVATYVSNQTVVNKKQQQIQAFARAMRAATEFIQQNEGKCREFIPLYTKIPQDLAFKIGLSEFSNSIDPADLEYIAKTMQQLGYIKGMAVPRMEAMIKSFDKE